MDNLVPLWKAAVLFRDAFGPEATVAEIITFLAIARAEARGEMVEPKELVALTKSHSSNISRHTLFLGDVKRNRKPGLGLITQTLSATDRRRRPITLTPKGRKFIHKLCEGFSKILPCD